MCEKHMKYMCVPFLCLTHISNTCPTYVAKLAVYEFYGYVYLYKIEKKAF